MERTEPALVPEWLRCTGNLAGGASSVQHTANSMRSRSSRSNNEKDSPRYLDRSSSSSSRRSSTSNGSAKHPYSSFSRSYRDKNRDREKDKSLSEDIWNNDSPDPLASILTSRVERSTMRRSQSLVSRKPGEPLPRAVEDSRMSANSVLQGANNLSSVQKAEFEKDFPSLGTEEKQGATGIRRVLSPGLSSAVRNLPTGNSGFLGGEKWTSALAEVPATLANSGMGHTPFQQTGVTFSNSSSGVCSTTALNMAEALSQPVARVRATTQLPDKSQRLEELAIKQSRQLIPMTPSMTKPLVPSSADKLKQPKVALKTNEVTVASRGVHMQPHSSHLAYQSRAVQSRSDSASTSNGGKFLVLKPGRDSVTIGAKDASSPAGDANGKAANGQLAMASSTPASMSSSNSMVSALENKVAALSLSSKSTLDKRSSQSLAQSRSEFFNLMRRKTSPCATIIHSDSVAAVSSHSAETSGEKFEGDAAISPCVLENGNQVICNGDRHDIAQKIKSFPDVGDICLSGNGSIYPDEEEAAFLRSLGWEENGGEDEGLTEEEINAFYQEYMNRRPSLEASRSSQLKCSTPSGPHNAISGFSSPDSSSSESEPEV
ncbi:uncharacterized protein LOC105176476 isoform X2 [Sesamum indicum]|uniref:Uncharacterized protein LOC105176476 isoform X2 n=1 Tax=Sesamum indicum TaxID=4182 RepID=A0A6I9US65_SESIN|nr:uncharacterized protein LOC105176476 isoform X2 [Sesamum indicum]